MIRFAGETVVARFDPDALHTEIHVYDLDGRFLMTAPVWSKTGFIDVEAAKSRARLETTHRRHARKALEAENLMEIADLAALMPEAPEPEAMSPNVIRPVRMRGSARSRPSRGARGPGLIHRPLFGGRGSPARRRVTPHLSSAADRRPKRNRARRAATPHARHRPHGLLSHGVCR